MSFSGGVVDLKYISVPRFFAAFRHKIQPVANNRVFLIKVFFGIAVFNSLLTI